MPKNWHAVLSRLRALRTPRRSSESNREGTKKKKRLRRVASWDVGAEGFEPPTLCL